MSKHTTLNPGTLSAKMKLGNDAGAKTVRDYLVKLLYTLWIEDEGFSGKRPFGNSGWSFDLYEALVKAKIVDGKFGSDGYLVEFDQAAANQQITLAILSLGQA